MKIIEQAGLEADDLLGTLSRRCEEQGLDVSIISGDRDTLQLATEHVKIRIPKTKQGRTEVEDYNADQVKERYGVTPQEFIDVKALMGDASDNIPGVPGVGEKTATKIIEEYHSLENAYAHVDEIKPPRASKNLKEYWDQARMSKVLATIETHADIPFHLEEARRGELYTPQAHTLFQRLQFKNLLSRFDVQADANKVEEHFREVTELSENREDLRGGGAGGAGRSSPYCRMRKTVLPLFAHASGYGRISLAYGPEQIVTIPCSMELGMDVLLRQAVGVGREGRGVGDVRTRRNIWISCRILGKTIVLTPSSPHIF